eukprot:2596160-Karenia_brevis.AAC.1
MPSGTHAAVDAHDGWTQGTVSWQGPRRPEDVGETRGQGQGAQLRICTLNITKARRKAVVWLAKLPDE